MRYLPHTEEEIEAMLRVVGAEDLDALFATVPPSSRLAGRLDLPPALTEWELTAHLEELATTMEIGGGRRVFAGAGSYEHHIPAAIGNVLSRTEFVTAYTPYQPEVSQGTLQAIFEYQTLVCRLLGMEVSNASLWDGASSLAEALLMAIRATRRRRVAVSRAVHPLYREVVRTYLAASDHELVEIPYGPDGRTDLAALGREEGLAAFAVQSPNFFGCVEDLVAAGEAARAGGGLAVVGFTEALAYGLLKSPGSCGADIACGEGQSLGIPQSYGGPYLGVMAAREKYTRNMPGRLVGKTVDREGREGYVITLATREQHIRREKATSNICSNQSLCSVTAAMYLATLGRTGARALARLNYDKAEYLKGRLRDAGVKLRFVAPTFNEFVAELRPGTYERLLEEETVAGVPLGRYYPDLEGCYVLCVTETKTRDDLDALVRGIAA